METDGTVTTGFGEGGKFLQIDFYESKFSEILGSVPYHGTLNIIISDENIKMINSIKKNSEIIKGENNFGSVKYIKAILNNEIKGLILFPEKSTHKENCLEFIAITNLREKLNLKDNDKVNLKITTW